MCRLTALRDPLQSHHVASFSLASLNACRPYWLDSVVQNSALWEVFDSLIPCIVHFNIEAF